MLAIRFVKSFSQKRDRRGCVQFAGEIISVRLPEIVAMQTGVVATLGNLEDKGLEMETDSHHFNFSPEADPPEDQPL